MDKCLACGEAVSSPEKVMTDQCLSYHKSCFKCRYGCSITLESHEILGGDMYCREHLAEAIKGKRVHDLPKNDQKKEETPFSALPEHANEKNPPASEKGPKLPSKSTSEEGKEICRTCDEPIDPQDKVLVSELPHHKSCFKCCHDEACTAISPTNYSMLCGSWYCNEHSRKAVEEGTVKNSWVWPWGPRMPKGNKSMR